MRNHVVTASEFKANCLHLLDEADNGGVITITRRGRPVATLQGLKKKGWKSPRGALIGKVKILGDIVSFETAEAWEALHEHSDHILRRRRG